MKQYRFRAALRTMKNTAVVCQAAGGAKPPESETDVTRRVKDNKQCEKKERGDRNLLLIS